MATPNGTAALLDRALRLPALDAEETAALALLYGLMPEDKKREFWQNRGDRLQKTLFLMRYGLNQS